MGRGWAWTRPVVAAVAIAVAGGALAGHASARAAAVGPSNTAPPLVTGSPAVGQTLTVSPGTWAGDVPISFAFQWEDCGTQPGCTAIPGATGTSYLVQPSDLGSSVVVSVTGSNDAGTAVALTSPTAACGPATRRSRSPSSGDAAPVAASPAPLSRVRSARPTRSPRPTPARSCRSS